MSYTTSLGLPRVVEPNPDFFITNKARCGDIELILSKPILTSACLSCCAWVCGCWEDDEDDEFDMMKRDLS